MRVSPGNLILASLMLLLGACSFNTGSILPDKQVEYKREKQADSQLEVPPDLTASTIDNQATGLTTPGRSSTTFSEYSAKGRGKGGLRQQTAVLPQIQTAKLQRDGDKRWLLIDAPAESVWPRIVEFWQTNGILLIEQDPAAGVMRTGWIENRADVKSGLVTDFMRGIFSGLYDAGTRDQFRLRLERTADNDTELYLTHFGMQEFLVNAGTNDEENTVWQHRPRDPELEAIMLQKILVYLGIAEVRGDNARAEAERSRIDAQLVNNSAGISLNIDQPFSTAWRYTGMALDRVGFVVEDRDRSRGIYYVRYRDPDADRPNEGWLDKLSFWKGGEKPDEARQYQIVVEDMGGVSRVTVNNDQGLRENSSTGKRLLTLIQEQLK